MTTNNSQRYRHRVRSLDDSNSRVSCFQTLDSLGKSGSVSLSGKSAAAAGRRAGLLAVLSSNWNCDGHYRAAVSPALHIGPTPGNSCMAGRMAVIGPGGVDDIAPPEEIAPVPDGLSWMSLPPKALTMATPRQRTRGSSRLTRIHAATCRVAAASSPLRPWESVPPDPWPSYRPTHRQTGPSIADSIAAGRAA